MPPGFGRPGIGGSDFQLSHVRRMTGIDGLILSAGANIRNAAPLSRACRSGDNPTNGWPFEAAFGGTSGRGW